MAAVIRLAEEPDAERMLAIYAPIVRDTAISFELEPPTAEEFSAENPRFKRICAMACVRNGRGYSWLRVCWKDSPASGVPMVS